MFPGRVLRVPGALVALALLQGGAHAQEPRAPVTPMRLSQSLNLPDAFTLVYTEVVADARMPSERKAAGIAAIHDRAPLASFGIGPTREDRKTAAMVEQAWPTRSFNVTFSRNGPELFYRIQGGLQDEILLYDGAWTYDYDGMSPEQRAGSALTRRFSRASVSPSLDIVPKVFPLPARGVPDLPLIRDIQWVGEWGGAGLAYGASPILATGAGRYGPEFAPSTLVFALDGGHARPLLCKLSGRDGHTMQEWLFGSETTSGALCVCEHMIFIQYGGEHPMTTRAFRLVSLSQQPVPSAWMRPETWLDAGANLQIYVRGGTETIAFDRAGGPLRNQVERGRREMEAATRAAERDAAHGSVFKGIFAVITIALIVPWFRRRRPRGSE